MRHFLTFFLIWSSILLAFEFSQEKFLQKLREPLPGWMREQIDEDFALYKERRFTRDSVKQTLKDIYDIPSGRQSCLVLFQIRNNTITTSSPSERLDDARIVHVKEVLEDISQCVPLPETDFLISIWDSFDNPIYLEVTKCPIFTICKLKTNQHGILFPEFRNFSYRRRLITDINWTSDRSPWEQKNPIGFWRGMTSGWHYTLESWDLRPRARLALLSKEHPESLDAAFTSPYSLEANVRGVLERYELFKPWSYPVDFVKNKYLISIDGNTFASNLWWQLLSNCAVLKTDSEYIEWFYKGLSPYVHYIPFSIDSSDLLEKIHWCKTHDDKTKKIALQGSFFAKSHLMNEDLMVYFYRALETYFKIEEPVSFNN